MRAVYAAIGSVFLVAASALPVPAQPFEQPPAFRIEKIAGFFPSGDNYTIKNPVRSDGLLRIYTVATPYGEFIVHGDQMLRLRLNELAALHELEKIAGSDFYGKALVEAGLSPFKYTGRLITDPKKTVGDTFSGINSMFGRISADLSNIGKTPGDPISGLLGVTDQRRKLATKVGVDPYTDFPPLDAKLTQLAQAAAAGGLTVQAAMLAVPVTTVGIVYSNLGTASDMERVQIDELARDRTVSQIFDLSREKLHAMGADIDLTEALLAKRNYTPIDMAALAMALDSLPAVAGPHGVPAAGRADRRPGARLFHAPARRDAEEPAGPGCRLCAVCLARRLSVQRHPRWPPGRRDAAGQLVLDGRDRGGLARMRGRCAAGFAAGRVELRITGTATPLARKELQALGWRVVENTRF